MRRDVVGTRLVVIHHHSVRLVLLTLLVSALSMIGGPLFADAPTTVVSELFSQWTCGGGFYYWAEDCVSLPDCEQIFLRRSPAHGLIDELTSFAPDDKLYYQNSSADNDGFYYSVFDDPYYRIYFRPTNNPEGTVRLLDSQLVPPLTRIVTDSTHVYWGAPDGIYRASKLGGGGTKIMTASSVTELVVDEDGLFFVSNNKTRLYKMDRCPSWPSCTIEQLLSWPDNELSLLIRVDDIFYFRGVLGGSDHIYKLNGLPGIIYSADPNIHIIALGSEGVHLFWKEAAIAGYDELLFRREIDDIGATPDLLDMTVTPIISPSEPRLLLDDWYVYYRLKSSGLRRLSHDAGPVPLSHDFRIAGMEVTQVIQSLNNDVALVANKPTYVKVLAAIDDSPSATGVTASLAGTLSGVSFPDSPIYPINGTLRIWSNREPGRANQDNYWLFKLPDSWTNAGYVTLSVTIDPMGNFDDPDLTNNSQTVGVDFHYHAPNCLVFLPVWTNHEGTDPSMYDPNVAEMIDVHRSMWPTSKVHTFNCTQLVSEWEFCWLGGFFPGVCAGPYELPEDGNWVISKIVAHDVLTDDPDICDDAGARTHYVGMVHHGTETGDLAGMGCLYLAAAFVKMPDPTPFNSIAWNQPRAGFTLSHELGHNYELRHVDCPIGEPANTNPYYPYFSCDLTYGLPETNAHHYGFDSRTLTPLKSNAPPSYISDLMSYANNRWPSDYTYGLLYNRSAFGFMGRSMDISHSFDETPVWSGGSERPAFPRNTVPSPMTIEQSRDLAKMETEKADGIVIVSGTVGPDQFQGNINPAYVFPPQKATSGLLRKWGEHAAIPIELAPDKGKASYAVSFIDTMGVTLGTYVIDPKDIMYDYEEPDMASFVATMPEPVGTVAEIRLVADGSVIIDRLFPGTAFPSVTIVTPIGGEIYDGQDPMIITWEASDPDSEDHLYHTVQYSPYAGSIWYSIATNIPHPSGTNTVSLQLTDLNRLPGSIMGSIRVITSDGYNTTITTSNTFTVTNRKPAASILWPQQDVELQAGRPIELRASAYDTEDGELKGSAFEWVLDGVWIGDGPELVLPSLTAGTYSLELRVWDSDFAQTIITKTITVLPRDIPTADVIVPVLDGLCDDEAYFAATAVQLRGYDYGIPYGTQSTVRFMRRDSDLFICFNGLPLEPAKADVDDYVSFRIDVNNSGGMIPETDDYQFQVYPDGTFYSFAGDGTGMFENPGPEGMAARVVINGDSWSAEMQIPTSVLAGWNHESGIAFAHHNYYFPLDDYFWPYTATPTNPDTWSHAVLGDLPWLESLTPENTNIGGADFTLNVTGSRFNDGAVVKWNGLNRVTTYIDSEHLQALITAADIASAGTAVVTVINPDLTGVPSNAFTFEIRNPTPVISQVTPELAIAGGAGFTLTVDGSLFVSGAKVLWNGEERATVFVNSGRVQATILATDLVDARMISITVINPSPSVECSNDVTFKITGPVSVPPVPNGGSIPGSALTVTRLTPNGISLRLDWDNTTCPAANYTLLYGSLETLSSSYINDCEPNIDSDADGSLTVDWAISSSYWFVIVGSNGASVEGSWGMNSNGNERNPLGHSSCSSAKDKTGICSSP